MRTDTRLTQGVVTGSSHRTMWSLNGFGLSDILPCKARTNVKLFKPELIVIAKSFGILNSSLVFACGWLVLEGEFFTLCKNYRNSHYSI